MNTELLENINIHIKNKSKCINRDCLIILKTEPYIDSVFFHCNDDGNINSSHIRRFIFKEDLFWNYNDEFFFEENCLKNEYIYYNEQMLDDIYDHYSSLHPQWHLQRYYTDRIRLLDHIHNCMQKNTIKELLYKSGLDSLAVHIDDLEEIDLMAESPSKVYYGLPMKVLRALNSENGSKLISNRTYGSFIINLWKKYPKIFSTLLNEFQCKYLKKLIDGMLTVDEAGRLFISSIPRLSAVWTISQYELYMRTRETEARLAKIAKIDPIYRAFIRDETIQSINRRQIIADLIRYLGEKRDEYDRSVRRCIRKKDPALQERDSSYVIRYPQTIHDFCREAVYMGNCLLTYTDAFLENDTDILFMRKADDVNTPYITVEIYEGSLMQAFRRYNEPCDEEEVAWLKDFCKRHKIKITFWLKQ